MVVGLGEPSKTLRACGNGLLLPGLLSLIAGAASIGARLHTHQWMEIMGTQFGPWLSALSTGLITVLGVGAIRVGLGLRRGSTRYLKVLLLATWCAAIATVGHLVITGRGLYELLFFTWMLIDGHVALGCGKAVRAGQPVAPDQVERNEHDSIARARP